MNYISLDTILSRGEKISPRVLYSLMHPLVERLIEMRELNKEKEKGKLNEQSILFSADFKDIVVTSSSQQESENVRDWGQIILKVTKQIGYEDKRLVKLATNCVDGKITTFEELHLQLERRVNHSIYKLLLALIIMGLIAMAILHFLF